MRRLRLLRTALLFTLTAFGATAMLAESLPQRVTIPAAAQPRLALAGTHRVFLAYGHGPDVFVTRSDDLGLTFAAPVKVATVPGLMLGMRRGPRIVARGDIVTVTLNQKDLLAFTSTDAGRTWSGPVTINDVPGSAREGLHDLALSPDGRAFITWLDLRLGKMALAAAESADGGRTWTRNEVIYRSPEISICECCHPSATFDTEGNLAVMWRNALGGARDLWLMTRPAKSTQFAAPAKQGEGSWQLKACPMDGGQIIPRGAGAFASIGQREGHIFFHASAGLEQPVARGKQPVAASLTSGTLLLWQQGTDLWSASLAATRALTTPTLLAPGARFPVLLALPDGRHALVTYEHGPEVIVARL